MTDRFKEAFDWCAKMRVLADSILADSCFTSPLDTIEQALTLATESEQLRKERDELAKAMLNTDLFDEDFWSEDVQKAIKLAKKVTENGNA